MVRALCTLLYFTKTNNSTIIHSTLELLNSMAPWLKPGFHYPSSRADRHLGCIFWHPSTRVSKMHPSSRAVNSAREFGPSTRVVETGVYKQPVSLFTLPLSDRNSRVKADAQISIIIHALQSLYIIQYNDMYLCTKTNINIHKVHKL